MAYRDYSRLKRVQEYQNKKTAMVFGGLTLFIIIFGFFFGIPLISKFVGLFSNSPKVQNEASTSPLLAPSLETPPQFTNHQSLIIKGSTTPNNPVKVFVNNNEVDATSDSDGNFTANLDLDKGDNTIFAVSTDKKGNTGTDSTHYTVNFDDEPPNLTLNSPTDGQGFFGDNHKSVNINGQTDLDASVTVNGRVAIVDGAGKFNLNMNLENGQNEINIVALDKAGNKKEINISVNFSS